MIYFAFFFFRNGFFLANVTSENKQQFFFHSYEVENFDEFSLEIQVTHLENAEQTSLSY